MFDLLSNRIRNANGEPEVYIYDDLPKEFRTQVYYILKDIVEPYISHKSNLWEIMHDTFAREKGLKRLGPYNAAQNNIEEYLDCSTTEDALDFIEYIFYKFDKALRKITPEYKYNYDSNKAVDKAITELNSRLRQHGLGYEFVDGEIIKIDNTIIHNEIIKPALRLIRDVAFLGAEQEIKKAFEYRRKSDNKNAILEAGKAFESIMKTICDRKGFLYDPNKDTAKKLIDILEKNGFFPVYMTAHLKTLVTLLETGLPVLRNKNAAHGQGSLVVSVPDELAEYALNLAASNIVFLVSIYINTKSP